MMEPFEPRIVAFLCNWCSYTGADLAGTSRKKYPTNIVPIRVMCSGRVDPEFILKAFRDGADGVLVCGCHPGDCHYISGNVKAFGRRPLIEKMLEQFGVAAGRYRMEWVSAAEGDRYARLVSEFTETVRALGPLAWNDKLAESRQIPEAAGAAQGGE
jgi:F420-non-reducing hydrogenase iron-sulfur subunit